ncbi:cytochrome c biogenesis protein CcsA [Micromonospora sp. HM5-17]|uniref:cytochrome c biogenesis protein CcsA n=1 Tax=Micromonospora sp. HM5-17 TaxID=2487710 RepID=UPI0018F7B8BF|nr:cytochrome c biogenesis protein CcsA [Micromonospora sp. HM5-17]
MGPAQSGSGAVRTADTDDRPGVARTPRAGDRRAAADRRSLGWLAGGLATAAAAAGLLIAPPDAVQGDAQRLMYLHVPAAWTAYLAFAAVLASSLGYLATRDPCWDRRARVAAELGVGLTTLTIALGALWGRAVWGAWWAWDPRLVSTVLLLLAYAGYLAARRVLGEGRGVPATHRVGGPAAVVGVAGFALVPLVHFSVVWWRSLHQPATILAPDRPPIDPLMAAALLLSLAAFTTTATWLFLRRLAALEPTPGGSVPTAAPNPVETR